MQTRWHKEGTLYLRSSLGADVFYANGRISRLGVLSRRVVTNAGVQYLRDCFMNVQEPENINWHDCGTGTNAEAVTDTALQTPYGGARTSGTQSTPASNQYRTVGLITFSGAFAIVEHGAFTAAVAGTLWDRSVFAAINVASGDAIQFTYTLTFTAGG